MANTINMENGHFEHIEYTPKCKFGYDDCIADPEYIRNTYPSWWNELQSSNSLSCDGCVNGSNYDDEDK